MFGELCLESPSDEIRVMRRLGPHPHIVGFVRADESASEAWSVLEYCAGGELFEIVGKAGRLDEVRCSRYMNQIASALAHCHARLIAHLDMSLENVLLDAHDNVKICDFGMAQELTRTSNSDDSLLTLSSFETPSPTSATSSSSLQSLVPSPSPRSVSSSPRPFSPSLLSPTSRDIRLNNVPERNVLMTDTDDVSPSTDSLHTTLLRLHSVNHSTFEKPAVSSGPAMSETPLSYRDGTHTELCHSRVATNPLKGRPGKLGYIPSEVYDGRQFDGRCVDMFALGVMLFMMLVGIPPWRLPTLSGIASLSLSLFLLVSPVRLIFILNFYVTVSLSLSFSPPLSFLSLLCVRVWFVIVDARYRLIMSGSLPKLLNVWGRSVSLVALDLLSNLLCPEESRYTIEQVQAHPFLTGTRSPLALIPSTSASSSLHSSRKTLNDNGESDHSKCNDMKCAAVSSPPRSLSSFAVSSADDPTSHTTSTLIAPCFSL
jgi:serine/threonine protein kinase